MKETKNKPKREPRKYQRLQLHDACAAPGIELMELIGHYRNPTEEALLTLDCWTPRLVINVVTLPR